MKTIGLLGGMSWESTVSYYQIINRTVSETLGGLHSAEILLYSVDFDRIERLQKSDSWDEAGEILAEGARRLQAAGADFLLICANTMHKVAPAVEAAVDVPLCHIADETAREIQRRGVSKVGLLGTRFTMEQDFYRTRLEEQFGLRVSIPPEDDRDVVHRIIYDELCRGQIREESRAHCQRISEELAAEGAEAIVLGCTEIPLLLRPSDTPTPLVDTTEIHARGAARLALE